MLIKDNENKTLNRSILESGDNAIPGNVWLFWKFESLEILFRISGISCDPIEISVIIIILIIMRTQL